MVYEAGDLKVFNPQKEISHSIVLEIIIRHRDALKQARTGELINVESDKIDDNQRKLNQVRGLNKVISAQREMITYSRPQVRHLCEFKWKNKNKTEEQQKLNPFEKEINDYHLLLNYLDFLKLCQKEIIEADKTKSKDDDFLISRMGDDGVFYELTDNFYDMLDDLETSFEKIYTIMLVNKIVSAGIEQDEELTYREKEDEAVRSVIEA